MGATWEPGELHLYAVLSSEYLPRSTVLQLLETKFEGQREGRPVDTPVLDALLAHLLQEGLLITKPGHERATTPIELRFGNQPVQHTYMSYGTGKTPNPNYCLSPTGLAKKQSLELI